MTVAGPAAKTFRLDGSYAAISRLYEERGWTDGLPIGPPGEENVREFLRVTDRGPGEVIAVLPPRQGEATVERIAVNAVMAGCKPEYLPVIIAAIEALPDPAFNLDSVQATTHPVAPLMIVNGPIARELEIHDGYNAFRQGFRANMPIGRAVRLLLMNVGGGLPRPHERSTHGGRLRGRALSARSPRRGVPAPAPRPSARGGFARYLGPARQVARRHLGDRRRRRGQAFLLATDLRRPDGALTSPHRAEGRNTDP